MVNAPRVHLTGASGSGTTTLGARLADDLGVVHVDTDDAYWAETEVPFTVKRPVEARLAVLSERLGEGGWVLSGSLMGWGEPVVEEADLMVFLTAPTEVRLARLKAREAERFGGRIAEGGDMEQVHRGFIDWAASYDLPEFDGRSRTRHEAWLEDMGRPVLRLDGTEAVKALARAVRARLAVI